MHLNKQIYVEKIFTYVKHKQYLWIQNSYLYVVILNTQSAG
jgi:hypothetical protein